MKLGILDWGIGGVGLLKKIRERSSMDIIYFSDTGYLPYGKVPSDELRSRVQDVIDFLRERGCDFIAVGCNAASTVIPNDERIIGVIQPAIERVSEMNIDSIGIVGGKRTIESEIYKREFEKLGMKVKQQIAQPLSARIESGDINSIELEKEIEGIFTGLKNERNILLACTHYPVIANKINEFLPDVFLIDPIEKMVEQVMLRLNNEEGTRKMVWMTSGNIDDMKRTLKIVYGIEANLIEREML